MQSRAGRSTDAAVVAGAYSEGNLGDIVLLLKSVGAVRDALPGAPVTVVSAPRPFLQRLLPDLRFVPHDALFPPRGRVLVYGGGTQFYAFDRAEAPVRTRALNALRSPRRLARGLLRRVVQPVVPRPRFERTAALGIGVGPFAPGSPREAQTRAVFERLGYVAVRDQASLDQCQRWGLTHAKLRADLCFAGGGLGELGPANRSGSGDRTLAVIVRTWRHTSAGAAYLEPLLAATAELAREGWTVTFFSFCEEEDRPLNARLRAAGYAVHTWDPLQEAPAHFASRIAECSVILSARYHGALFAGLLGRPSITIELEPKLRIAAQTLDTPELVWAQPFDGADLRRLVEGLASDEVGPTARVQAAVLRQKRLADTMVAEFAEFARG